MSPEERLLRVCEKHGISTEMLRCHRRDKALVAARRECCVELRTLGLSLPNIGKLMNRDHTSVLHHLKARLN